MRSLFTATPTATAPGLRTDLCRQLLEEESLKSPNLTKAYNTARKECHDRNELTYGLEHGDFYVGFIQCLATQSDLLVMNIKMLGGKRIEVFWFDRKRLVKLITNSTIFRDEQERGFYLEKARTCEPQWDKCLIKFCNKGQP